MGEMTTADRQLIARRILFAIMTFAVLCLVFWLLFLRTNDKPANKTTNGTGRTQQTEQSPPGAASGAPQAAPNTQAAGQPNQLANTGPGDTLTLFLIVAATTTIAHSLYKRHVSSSH